ncbi:MAG: hypothetical protein KGJ23_08575 [Euryarchaeota archaeon]|nr:hypothetical protein [Euryarchaeota archaeon]MDE1836657.1 hypothetical protein [Euryarchaeota archaeon]MDE1880314.1 hypothetical protein [Euryarchaeota archaeon]MDE2044627.1 hypothetical protein [Thermoplasmata archaeon]
MTDSSASPLKWHLSPGNRRALKRLGYGKSGVKAHLAIMRAPHYQNLLDGTKVWETRVTKVKAAPYGRVKKDDVVIWKPVGGTGHRASRVLRVVSDARAPGIGFHEDIWTTIDVMDTATRRAVEEKFNEPGYDYVTFIRVSPPIEIGEFKVQKKDSRAWVVLEAR